MSSSTPISKHILQTFKNALERCGDKVDLSGWRYSKYLGYNDYIEIDVEDPIIQRQFDICLKFLKEFFPRSHHRESIYSEDLKCAVETWWEKTTNEKIFIDNGIMLVALVAKKLCPENMWLNGDISQPAMIPPGRWRKFCNEYDYEMKMRWEDVFPKNVGDDEPLKMN